MSIGIDLGLDIAGIAGSAGLSGSVATTHTKGTTQGVTGSCPPGPWSCSLSITPQIITVSGLQETRDCDSVTAPGGNPYTVTMPQMSSDNLVHADVDICTCQIFQGGLLRAILHCSARKIAPSRALALRQSLSRETKEA